MNRLLATFSGVSDLMKNHFHEQFYLSRYPDVMKSGWSAWAHYRKHGLKEGRQPRGDFDPVYYESRYGSEFVNELPFIHWVKHGRANGYAGHPWIVDPAINDNALMAQIFDADFYLERNPDVKVAGFDPFDHFISLGWKEFRNPTQWFDLHDYLVRNPEIQSSGLNPFSHFVVMESDYLIKHSNPNSIVTANSSAPFESINVDEHLFRVIEGALDIEFYRAQFMHNPPEVSECVLHYIKEGVNCGLDPNKWFSTRGYLQSNADVLNAGINPLYHYICQGKGEGRRYGINQHGQENAFDKYSLSNAFDEHSSFTSTGPNFESIDIDIIRSKAPRAKILAYYLPQFHAIPENDSWWGEGFTEWRNIIRGQPRFRGHQQPRVPEQLGFYDLANPSVIRRQVELAKLAGIFGFCFYYYNFNGRRILEKPLEAFLSDKSIDFPFALMWANENWTRTWDGMEKAVLLKQDYRHEDELPLLEDFARHFADPRYFRINGRPLLFIYRPGQIPDAKQRFKEWRNIWKEAFGEQPLLFMVQGFDDIDPMKYDLDGAIEFPPHKICKDMPPINNSLEIFDPKFAGHVVSYPLAVERSISEPAPDFPLIKTAVPSWDNEARRPGRGMTLHGATPFQYERWLRSLVEFAREHPVFGEKIVAVNAWNEWAEGAYLEPDVYSGAAYLNSTARAVTGTSLRDSKEKPRILVVGHDAYRHGAQLLLRGMIDVFSSQFGFHTDIVICGDGPLLEDYRSMGASCSVIRRGDDAAAAMILASLYEQGVRRAILNTTVSGWLAPHLKRVGFEVTVLVHELPRLLQQYDLKSEIKKIAECADTVVFPAELVRESFLEICGPINGQILTRPQGLYRTDVFVKSNPEKRKLRTKYGIPFGAKVIINVGFADTRKGFDIFLRIAAAACKAREELYFIWVGSASGDAENWHLADLAGVSFRDRIKLTGFTDSVPEYYAIADVFLLTSREDPFPSVVLEAFAAGVPVVGIRGTSGLNGLIERHGELVDLYDESGQLCALDTAIAMPRKQRMQLSTLVAKEFQFDDYCYELAKTLYMNLPKLSVVVPNYNYARYLRGRLNSIFRQTHPVFEVIVLDDHSTDESLAVIETAANEQKRKIKVVTNEANSGSVFRQWRKGVEAARGEYIWIAEADDDCEDTFVQKLLNQMVQHEATFGFTDSSQIDMDGEVLGESYRSYLAEDSPDSFESSFTINAKEFLARHLSVKNVILNVSGAIFKREALLGAITNVGEELLEYKVAGDWRLYIEMCQATEATVSYVAEPLNIHRRHSASVTHSLNAKRHLEEIRELQVRAIGLGESEEVTVKAAQNAYLARVSRYLGIMDFDQSEKKEKTKMNSKTKPKRSIRYTK